MSDGVIYMLTGLKHANHLVVSLRSLVDRWDGPVALIAGCADAEAVCRRCASDGRLGDLRVIRWDAPTRRSAGTKGQQYLNKCEMGRLSPFRRSVFLDADTLVVGEFSELFPLEDEVRLTWFAQWVTTGSMMRGRIEKWRAEMPAEVARAIAHPYPAINTGVIGFSRRCVPWMERWREVAAKRADFICDEIAAQLIFPDLPHMVLDERWNCSVVYSWERHGTNGTGSKASGGVVDPRIWHGHGKKFLKRETGRMLWLPWWQLCMSENIAGISEWSDTVPWSPAKFLQRHVPEEAGNG